jgi:hypothetical protein
VSLSGTATQYRAAPIQICRLCLRPRIPYAGKRLLNLPYPDACRRPCEAFAKCGAALRSEVRPKLRVLDQQSECIGKLNGRTTFDQHSPTAGKYLRH